MEFKMKDGGFVAELPYGKLDISGDENYGFRPYQLLVSSLAICSGGILRNILEKMRLDVQDIQITAETERNREKANRVEKVTLHFKITGKGLKKEKLERVMALTRKNCAMVQSVEGSIEVEETFEIVEV
ncbi:osmotically inducible protein C [Siminovitchia terrae]|uniref:Osmotically inducible protein C n=1 Tax=Siminovitchia terrae TaxID=1914933 RepID=A0ABQ4L2S6_SIMTE|nr:OsmC family protein [Siminovitchia terrae]GIN92205.1 osmotically inducible protein C [Siminovitchia terrae]GIN98171.1 osmotically inducible protein C [Siminovitchia terrae]